MKHGVEIGGIQQEQKVSRPKNANSFDYCRPKKKPTIRIMFWGSIANGYKGPYHIWMKETSEEKRYFNNMVTLERQANRDWVDTRRRNASIEGTEEFYTLQDIHQRIIHGPRTAAGKQHPRPCET